VWPTDLDVLRHVNNGVYFSLMDLGRVDLMARSEVLPALRARGWYPVSGEQTIRFRRSLTLGQRFAIETRVLGWDDRAVVLGQDFLVPGEAAPVADVLALAGHTEPSPPLPAWVARWAADQDAARAADRQARPAA
jgi:acyl-CoA thioesterase FadM